VSWALLAAVGGFGAVARFRLDAFVQGGRTGDYPLGTLVVNVVGALVLGLLTGLGITGTTLFVLGTGFLGSFTTFSTWMLEAHRLGEDGEGRTGLASLAVGVAAGLAAAGAGWAIGAAL
jgi:fluoride exporter